MIALRSAFRTGLHSGAENSSARSGWPRMRSSAGSSTRAAREIESGIIAKLRPPPNLGENRAHSFHATLGASRRNEDEGKRQGAVSRSVLE
jgi:hypothetical protein